MNPTPKKVRERKVQIVVTCDGCKGVMASSDEMAREEAERMKSRLVMNPFGAPRCKACKIEPYSDINLAHTITIESLPKIIRPKTVK